jgi:hypothetical protein
MSMLCWVLGLSPEQVKALRAAPDVATEVAMAAMGDDSGDLSRFGPLQEGLDLQKSWHILHYLFTGSLDDARSPGAALLSGEELGEDIGYGPVRLHDPKRTTEFARFLEGNDLASVLARMNVAEMARIGIYGMPMGPESTAKCATRSDTTSRACATTSSRWRRSKAGCWPGCRRAGGSGRVQKCSWLGRPHLSDGPDRTACSFFGSVSKG